MLKKSQYELEKNRTDVGFGSNTTDPQVRLLRKDGTFNVKKIGQSFTAKSNIFHRLINISWWKFAIIIFTFYFICNIIFGLIYVCIGIEHLNGIISKSPFEDFLEAFFFSSQTLTTLGYGRVAPVGFGSNLIASFEALIGLLAFSLTTGLLYGRFSRPVPKILYSEQALITPYLDMTGFMVRLANEKSNMLIDVHASLIFTRNETINGKVVRKYYPLELERSTIKYFSLSWTLVHPITKESPLYFENLETLKNSNAEFLITLDAINDTFSDAVHSRKSYLFNEIVWNEKFINMVETRNSEYLLDLTKISSTK
jgi:inward rectifier potassium channel